MNARRPMTSALMAIGLAGGFVPTSNGRNPAGTEGRSALVWVQEDVVWRNRPLE